MPQVRHRMRDHRAAQRRRAALGNQQPPGREHRARARLRAGHQRLHLERHAGEPAREQPQRGEAAGVARHPNWASTKPCSALAMSGSSVSARVIVISQLSRGVTPSRISTPA